MVLESVMNRAKRLRGKSTLVTFLSLGLMVLGIGCICWALINIAMQTVNAVSVAPLRSEDSSDILNAEKILYTEYPAEGDYFGTLSIPALNQKWPIIQGTDVEELKKGVGHFNQSVLPGEKDNCVLSGHRETVFAELGNLKKDDQLIIQTSAGTFTYVIKSTRIVDKDDKTVIVPTDHAVLTVTTCYPFRFIGNAPERYIVTADLVISN